MKEYKGYKIPTMPGEGYVTLELLVYGFCHYTVNKVIGDEGTIGCYGIDCNECIFCRDNSGEALPVIEDAINSGAIKIKLI